MTAEVAMSEEDLMSLLNGINQGISSTYFYPASQKRIPVLDIVHEAKSDLECMAGELDDIPTKSGQRCV